MASKEDNPSPDASQILLETKRIEELCRHIDYVKDAARRIGHKCIENGDIEFGRNLIANSYIHDQSKFRGIEWETISSRSPEDEKHIGLAIIHHQKVNMHHPEYWNGVSNMPELYIAEMVCDTYARSIEMGTNLREWWKDHGMCRYEISKNGKTWKTIKKYIDMLLDEQFK